MSSAIIVALVLAEKVPSVVAVGVIMDAAGFEGRAAAGTTYIFPLKEKCRLFSAGFDGCLFLSVLDLVGWVRDTWTRERTRRTDAESDSCMNIEMHTPLSLSSYLCPLPQV